jgi:hypothetical protein
LIMVKSELKLKHILYCIRIYSYESKSYNQFESKLILESKVQNSVVFLV